MKKLPTTLESKGVRLGGISYTKYEYVNEESYSGLPEEGFNGVYCFKMRIDKPIEQYRFPSDYYVMEMTRQGCSELVWNDKLKEDAVNALPWVGTSIGII